MSVVGLGRPIRVCAEHVAVLECPCRGLGVDLDGVSELQAATHDGCAVCRMPPRRSPGSRPFRVLRKCQHQRCYGRFHQSSYDELHIGEWLGFWRRWPRRITRLYRRRLPE